MEGNGEFDHTEPRAKVPACGADGVDGLRAEFVRQLPKFNVIEPAQIGGNMHAVEKRSRPTDRHFSRLGNESAERRQNRSGFAVEKMAR
jgi:hypothetical protein